MTIQKSPEAILIQKMSSLEKLITACSFNENAAVSLCQNCSNNDYCFWQENKKTYCEHYQ